MLSFKGDDMRIWLARTVLFLITEEQCSIINIKRVSFSLFILLANEEDLIFWAI